MNKTHLERLPVFLPFYHGTVITEDSVTIFKIIDSVRKVAEKYNDDGLRMEASLMYTHYFYYRSRFDRGKTLSVIDSVRLEAIQRKKLWAEAMTENMAALHNFKTLQNYELAFEHHHRVYNLIKDLSPLDFPHKQNCLYQIADEYYFFGDYQESIHFNRLALEAEPPFPLFENLRIIILNTLGLAYQKLNRIDSSDHYLQQAYSLALKEKSIAWQGISSGNLGYNAFLRRQYNIAIPLLEKDALIAVQFGDWGLAAGSLMVLGDISLQQKDIAKARAQLIQARAYVYRSEQFQRLQILYPLLSRLYAAEGNAAMATMFLDSALFVKDSLARKLNALQLLRAKQKVDREKYRSDIENIKGQRKLNILERNILIAVVLLLMAGAVIIYKYQQKKYRLKQQELEAASKQLKDFARNISEKNALIEILEKQHGDETSEALQQLRQSTILTDDDWEYFRNLFEKVHLGFFNRLKEKMPGLTPAETRFIVLTKLGLSGKEMAAMLGIGADAVRQLRSRVRKKMNLGEDANMDEVVSSI